MGGWKKSFQNYGREIYLKAAAWKAVEEFKDIKVILRQIICGEGRLMGQARGRVQLWAFDLTVLNSRVLVPEVLVR
jgi:hypothetical protein